MRTSHKVKFDVLLTNYELVNVDSTTLNSIDWSVLVIDEAHRLKNQQSLVSFSRLFTTFPDDQRSIHKGAQKRLGTPLPNSCLFRFCSFSEL